MIRHPQYEITEKTFLSVCPCKQVQLWFSSNCLRLTIYYETDFFVDIYVLNAIYETDTDLLSKLYLLS